MENIIDKLNQIDKDDINSIRNNWTLEEMKALLDIYLIISKKESHIFHLIYQYHSCDSWEDIFRDYDKTYLKDKAKGVKIAIKYIKNELKNVDRKQDLSVLTAETDV